jgi:NAD(P)H-hydrate epimerase
MSGAIALAGQAALRGGAGLVKLAVPDRVLETVAAFDPCYMTVPLADDMQGCIEIGAYFTIRELADGADCVAIGPGLGRSDMLTQLVTHLYQAHTGPMVLDADALNALAASDTLLAGAAGPRILTPHPGEFSRLVGGAKLSRAEAIARAEQLAAEHDVVIVLKGNQTLVTNGTQSYRNATGNPGMATGGTGDCLTGIITALVCQQMTPFDAAVLGVHVHGLAGDLAAEQVGQVALIASDLVKYLPAALRKAGH